MKMEIIREIISKENIKPSSPTPPNLKIHKLSLLDQIFQSVFVPVVLYFPVPENPPKNADEFISQTSQNLKRSLSDTLSRFYPLAGRIRDSLSIDCNDDGVLFVVSKIRGNLSDFLKKPDKTKSGLLIPIELSWTDEPGPGTHVLMIQVNYFDCGGSAIGSLFWHKTTDGVTIGTFLKTWAAISRGNFDKETTGFPDYTAGTLFPQYEAMEKESSLFLIASKKYSNVGKPSRRRYVFNSSAISTLRTKLTAPDHQQGQGLEFRPSRVEIVSALIWKCFMMAILSTNNKSSRAAKSLVSHSVNIRRKADPPFPEHSFGNFVWLAQTSSINKIDQDGAADMKHLIRTMRGVVNKIDGGFLRRMQGDRDGFKGYEQNVEETWKESPEEAEYLSFASWCNFGLYQSIDFGYGKPVWIAGYLRESDKEHPFFNMIWLMDTRDGDGIEAWVYIDEQYFEAFEKIQDLQAHASFDPSPFLV